MEKMLLTIIIFLLFLSLFTGGTLYQVTQYNGINNTEFNSTIVRGGNSGDVGLIHIPAPPVCLSLNTGVILIDISGVIGCAGSYVIWLGSLATVQSDIQWVGFIFIALIAVLVIIIIKIISGLIPLIPGVRD